MKSKTFFTIILEKLLSEVGKLSPEDIEKIENGELSLAIKLTKVNEQEYKKSESKKEIKDNFDSKEEEKSILINLKNCKTREDGLEVLKESLSNKKELEIFARYLDVSISKRDKVDQIRDKIIEATVGAILRSNAIQGKTIDDKTELNNQKIIDTQ